MTIFAQSLALARLGDEYLETMRAHASALHNADMHFAFRPQLQAADMLCPPEAIGAVSPGLWANGALETLRKSMAERISHRAEEDFRAAFGFRPWFPFAVDNPGSSLATMVAGEDSRWGKVDFTWLMQALLEMRSFDKYAHRETARQAEYDGRMPMPVVLGRSDSPGQVMYAMTRNALGNHAFGSLIQALTCVVASGRLPDTQQLAPACDLLSLRDKVEHHGSNHLKRPVEVLPGISLLLGRRLLRITLTPSGQDLLASILGSGIPAFLNGAACCLRSTLASWDARTPSILPSMVERRPSGAAITFDYPRYACAMEGEHVECLRWILQTLARDPSIDDAMLFSVYEAITGMSDRWMERDPDLAIGSITVKFFQSKTKVLIPATVVDALEDAFSVTTT